MQRSILSYLVLAILAFTAPYVAAEVKIGVVAPVGKLEAQVRWAEFGRYLTEKLKQPVTILPYTSAEVVGAARAGEMDFVVANPVRILTLLEKDGANLVASLNMPEGPQFAGVIVSAKRSGIKKASELAGKKVMGGDKGSGGAHVFQRYHLLQNGVNLDKDVTFQWSKQQEDTILAVGAGLADAAFVRSGVLETMVKANKIKLSDFTIVDQRKTPGYSFIHTTPLYPDWYLASLKHVDKKTFDLMKAVVLKMDEGLAACKTAKIKGFVEPVALGPIKEVLQTLQLPPYDK